MDMTPSMHWPSPPPVENHDRGPVLITIKYEVAEAKVATFLDLMQELGRHRRRDGAFSWGVFEDTETPRCYIESFNDESWLTHMRQHERVTAQVGLLQTRILACLVANTEPAVTHYLAP